MSFRPLPKIALEAKKLELDTTRKSHHVYSKRKLDTGPTTMRVLNSLKIYF